LAKSFTAPAIAHQEKTFLDAKQLVKTIWASPGQLPTAWEKNLEQLSGPRENWMAILDQYPPQCSNTPLLQQFSNVPSQMLALLLQSLEIGK